MSIIIQPIIKLLQRLWQHLSSRRRVQFGALLVLMLLTSLAEIIGIGAVLPFLAVIVQPEIVFEHPFVQPIIQAMKLNEPSQLLLPVTIAFGLAAIIAGTMRIVLLWASTRLSFGVGADLSSEIYRRTLYQTYAVHCERNSSEVINGISGKANGVIYSTLMPTLTLISSCLMLLAILIALFALEPVIALIVFGGFSLIYALIISLTRKQLLIDSQRVARYSNNVIKSLQEGLGGIRDVLIDGSQETYCQIYQDADLPLRRAQGNTLFIANCPRYAIEALGMLLIAALAFFLSLQSEGITKAIPILGALALGAQRLLPVLQQAYSSWIQIKGGQFSLNDTLELLDQPLPSHVTQLPSKPIQFDTNIDLKNLSFQYSPNTSNVLSNLNLCITKGSRVGFIGTTGSGKTTLLDIVMGLLEPTNGTLEVDGITITPENTRSWQAHIAHVPQSIFLSDSTIEENIAFGVEKNKINLKKVEEAASRAQIAETIERLPSKYQTVVGERGVRLSGGQRQRIGIARAFYKQADVIIFDEATSALDNETEHTVMAEIENLSKNITLLIIAHRLTTLEKCSQVVELGDGKIMRIGSYEDIVKQFKIDKIHEGKI